MTSATVPLLEARRRPGRPAPTPRHAPRPVQVAHPRAAGSARRSGRTRPAPPSTTRRWPAPADRPAPPPERRSPDVPSGPLRPPVVDEPRGGQVDEHGPAVRGEEDVAGDTSAWTTPASCSSASAVASGVRAVTTSPNGSAPRIVTTSRRLPPSASPMTSATRPSSERHPAAYGEQVRSGHPSPQRLLAVDGRRGRPDRPPGSSTFSATRSPLSRRSPPRRRPSNRAPGTRPMAYPGTAGGPAYRMQRGCGEGHSAIVAERVERPPAELSTGAQVRGPRPA